jgi:16S rRNA processing protein RimM
VKSVQNFGAGDLLEIRPPSGAAYLLPFTEENFPEIEAGLLRAAPDEALLPDALARPDSSRTDPTPG